MEKEIMRDLLTRELLDKASPVPTAPADFTARVLSQIQIETAARRQSIYQPLITAQVWRRIIIALSSIVLFTLGLSVFTFGSWPVIYLNDYIRISLPQLITADTGELNHLTQLIFASLICFCWLILDYCYGQLKKNKAHS